MAASNLKSVSFSLRFLLGNLQKWDEILKYGGCCSTFL